MIAKLRKYTKCYKTKQGPNTAPTINGSSSNDKKNTALEQIAVETTKGVLKLFGLANLHPGFCCCKKKKHKISLARMVVF